MWLLNHAASDGGGRRGTVELSRGERQLDPLPEERMRRCLACGQRFSPLRLDGGPDRCRACAESHRPVDLVMRWIWAEDDSAA